jgi:serine/threonine-protein kinase
MDQPKRIGDYEVLGKLGAGGMGEVYKVRNVISDRVEAMKVLLPDLVERQDLAARFLREIKVLAALHHPNIAALRTALTVDNQLVMIMEFVEGESLSTRLGRGALSTDEALGCIDQVLDALDYAHAQGVIHRDIKPANFMLTPQGVVKLTDFGIARSASDHTLTVAGTTTGSLSYMSPEQVNSGPTDPRSDLYSVGVSLYELVTGQRPFRATTGFALMLAHLKEEPTPPLDVLPGLDPELNRLILKAMAKNPADRFQSAADMRSALNGVPATLAGRRVAKGPQALTAAEMVALGGVDATFVSAPALPSPGAPTIAAGAGLVAAAAAAAPPAVPALPLMSASPAAPAISNAPAPRVPDSHANAGQGGVLPPPRRVQGGINPILYVALGAFLVVAAVGGMAYYSRSAEATPSGAPSTEPLPAASATPTPADTTATSSPAPAAPAPAADTPAAPAAADPAATTAATTSAATPPPVDAPPPTPIERNVAAAIKPPATRTRATTSEPAAAVVDPREAAAPPARTSQPAAVAPVNADADALDELENELDQLSARATAINGSLDRLKSEQARQGFGLRGDMAARQQSLNNSLSKANEAIERKDLARARRFRAIAQTDLETLEKFMGR